MYQKSLLLLAALLLPLSALAVPHWEVSGSGFVAPSVSQNTAALVFVRPNKSLDANSTTNLAVNDRYVASLQDGHYVSTVVCAGNVALSAVPSKAYTNDLSANAFLIHLPAGFTQFVYVDVDESFNATLRPLTEEDAQQVLASGLEQTHQRSRSFAENCPL